MKKIYIIFLIFSSVAQAQIVNIPDGVLLTKLLEANSSNSIAKNRAGVFFKIDSNNDNQIQLAEALEVSYLTFYNAGIGDATGLSDFVNLTFLSLNDNEIVGIPNLNMLANLKTLDVSDNPITEFDVSALTNLEVFDIDSTPIISLDFNGLTNLKQISCINCISLTDFKAQGLVLNHLTLSSTEQLTNLDLSNTTLYDITFLNDALENLETLNLSGTSLLSYIFNYIAPNLRKLDISNSTGIGYLGMINYENLTELNITNSELMEFTAPGLQLSAVDFTGLNKLTYLNVENSLITSLDLSDTKINTIVIDNTPISFLNIKNGIISAGPFTSEFENPPLIFRLENTPLLKYICVDEGEIPVVASFVSGNVAIGSYCSFTPGGDYNTISGQLIFDGDNNGCSVADITHPLMKIKISDGTTDGANFTDSNGNYSFFTGAGTHTITPDFENQQWFATSPPTATVNFPLGNSAVETQNFCIVPIGEHYDTEIVITPINAARPGFDAAYKLVYKNKGNRTVSGMITLNFDDAVSDFVFAATAPALQSTGILQWNFSELQPFESREIELRLNINSPVEIPAVNIDDQLLYTASIMHSQIEETPADNNFYLVQTVIDAYDPNDKTCLEGTTITPAHIGKYLHYNINFENTGNADAINVVVKDYIDPLKFDIKSLQVLNSSHAVKIKVSGNFVEFIFENINLRPSAQYPIGGHGNVLFKIKTNPNLTVGDTVENTANIYFDYNAPIETNEAKTTFALLNNQEFERDNSVKTYPNPANDFAKIESKNAIKSIQLFDIQGRILQTVIENKKETTLDLSKQSNGIYFLKINTEKGSKVEKIIKE